MPFWIEEDEYEEQICLVNHSESNMATLLGANVATSVLRRSDAEKTFRPWWDNFEDQLVYGLICLGKCLLSTNFRFPAWEDNRNQFLTDFHN